MELPEFALDRIVEAHDGRFGDRFIVVSRATGVYHRPTCPVVVPEASDRAFFGSAVAAGMAGFAACPICDPARPVEGSPRGGGKRLGVSALPRALPEPTGSVQAIAMLRLPFRPPYDWATISRFLGQRAIPGVESVAGGVYRRTISVAGRHGAISVQPVAGVDYLVVRIAPASLAAAPGVIERLRHLFDLDANVAVISRHLSESPLLTDVVARDPGLRLPGAWDSFELAVRAILGQQVSVAGARTLAGRIAATFGEPLMLDGPSDSDVDDGMSEGPRTAGGLSAVFPRPETLADADLSTIGLTGSRQSAIRSLARAVATDPSLLERRTSLAEAVEALCRLPGIGDWTAQYVAMRALGEPDAFPASDLGLRHALATTDEPAPKPKRILALAEPWRPWRGYAVMHLWMAPRA